MSNPKLKPCPFCGGKAVYGSVWKGCWYAACDDETGKCISPGTQSYPSKESAANAWNTRVEVKS